MVDHLRLELSIKLSTGFIFIYHVGWVVGGMVVTTMTYYHVWNHFRADLTLSRVENSLKWPEMVDHSSLKFLESRNRRGESMKTRVQT